MRWLRSACGPMGLAAALWLCACPSPAPVDDAGLPVDAGPIDAGCAPGTLRIASGDCVETGPRCGDGFTRDETGLGCTVGPLTCDAGSMSVPGEDCRPVGWQHCPAGFTRSDDGWSCTPVLPPTACTGATRAALGSATCTPIGDCAAPFPPADATLFVDASLTQPDATHFTTLAAAVAAAPAGATIAVFPGDYAESVTLPRAVKLVGRCAAQVKWSGSPALQVTGVRSVTLSGFTVHDSLVGLRVERGGTVTGSDLVFDHNLRSAVQLLDTGTEVTLERVVVRDTQADPATATFGQGLAASFAGGLTLRDAEVTGNREAGVFLDRDGTHATLSRVVVSNTLPRASTGTLGWGIAAQRGASLQATDIVSQGNTTSGVVFAASPTTGTLRDVSVRDTHPGIDNGGTGVAIGVSVSAGAKLTWTGGQSSDAPGLLVHAAGAGTELVMREVTLRDGATMGTLPTSGVTVEDTAHAGLTEVAVLRAAGDSVRERGSTLSLDHVAIVDAKGGGVAAQGGRCSATGLSVDGHADVGVRALEQALLSMSGVTISRGTSAAAFGLGAQDATLLVDRFVVRGSVTAGVYARSGGSAVLANGRIEGTALDDAGEYGQGAIAESAAQVTLTDVTLSRNHSAGLQSADLGSLLTADHVLVHGTLPNGTGTRGRGANANFRGDLHATATVFLEHQQVGVFAFQSKVELVDSFVQGVTSDPGGLYGNGIEALTDGVIRMQGGAVSGCAGIAAVFAEGAGVVDGVRVAGNEVGLHAQDDSVVEERSDVPATLGAREVVVTDRTVFDGNGAKLSSTTVPVPPP